MAQMNEHDYVAMLVEKAKKAQAVANNFTQEDCDLLTAAVAYALTMNGNALKYGQMLVEESGMGIAEDKEGKMYGKIWGSYVQMKDKKSVGIVDDAPSGGENIVAYAKPMGVIAAIMPVTNGEATPVVKANMALKTRNAVIFSPHPKAKKLCAVITEHIRKIVEGLGYPADLVQTVEPEMVNLRTSLELMKQCDFILATGGEALVEAAYSSGTPAIGVGVGNTVSIIDGSTDMGDVAEMIVKSKKYDNATSCSTENNVVVFESCYDAFVEEMAKRGAVLFKDDSEEKAKLRATMWPNYPNDHILNRAIVAQSAKKIAELAGLDVPEDTKVLMCEENGGIGLEFPFTGEKLSPVSGVYKVKDFDEALAKLEGILDYMGKGHSCGIHTTNEDYIDRLAKFAPVTKVVVNQPQCLTNSGGFDTGFPVSMSLGCGTWGGNSLSHNATYKDLLNYTYVSRAVPNWKPDPMELFDPEIRAKADAIDGIK